MRTFGDPVNHQITDKLALIHTMIERYTRHVDILVYEATVQDPLVFTKPWVLTPRLRTTLHPSAPESPIHRSGSPGTLFFHTFEAEQI